MNAEIGIDEEGRAYLLFTPSSMTESSMLTYMRPFLPMRDENDGCNTMRIVGDRLPGAGKAP